MQPEVLELLFKEDPSFQDLVTRKVIERLNKQQTLLKYYKAFEDVCESFTKDPIPGLDAIALSTVVGKLKSDYKLELGIEYAKKEIQLLNKAL